MGVVEDIDGFVLKLQELTDYNEKVTQYDLTHGANRSIVRPRASLSKVFRTEAGKGMQLDVKDAAGIFSVSEKTILRWIKQKDLPSYQVNDHYRFNRAESLEWATERKIDLSTQIMSEPGEGEGTASSSR